MVDRAESGDPDADEAEGDGPYLPATPVEWFRLFTISAYPEVAALVIALAAEREGLTYPWTPAPDGGATCAGTRDGRPSVLVVWFAAYEVAGRDEREEGMLLSLVAGGDEEGDERETFTLASYSLEEGLRSAEELAGHLGFAPGPAGAVTRHNGRHGTAGTRLWPWRYRAV